MSEPQSPRLDAPSLAVLYEITGALELIEKQLALLVPCACGSLPLLPISRLIALREHARDLILLLDDIAALGVRPRVAQHDDAMTSTEAWCRWYIAQAFCLWSAEHGLGKPNFVETQRAMGLYISRHNTHQEGEDGDT